MLYVILIFTEFCLEHYFKYSLYIINLSYVTSSLLAKGYDPLYSSSPLASLDGFSRSHGDGLYVMQLVVAATIIIWLIFKRRFDEAHTVIQW
jgi:hypothetical protein